ncbi:MAG: hypothetical protein NTY46_14740 [Candidatus Sumerlaeota bacterium]|nr:hypothetical protein [Candidatus Sumerlaeota bacterium]
MTDDKGILPRVPASPAGQHTAQSATVVGGARVSAQITPPVTEMK